MRAKSVLVLLCLACRPAVPSEGTAADAPTHWIVPQLGVDAFDGRPTALRLAHVRARATIGLERATTELVLALENPGGEPQGAALLVPLPGPLAGPAEVVLAPEGGAPGAVATREVAADAAVAELLELARASANPRALEFAGRACLRADALLVPPGASELRVRYEHALVERGADPRHPAPMYELPRCEGLGAYTIPWTLDLVVRSEAGLADVFCPTHRLVERSATRDERVLTALAGRHPEPGPLRLFPIAERGDLATLLLTWPAEEGGGRFALVAAASAAARDAARAQRRELTFVLDTSGSMAGAKIEQAREAARQVLESLRAEEAFNVIAYSSDVRALFDAPRPATPENLAEAREFLAATEARGGTFIDGALARALSQPRTEGTLPLVLFLTDGLPTVGPKSERTIATNAEQRNRGERRLFCFGVGEDVNAPLLDALAHGSGAASHFVAPDEDIEEEVARVHAGLVGPLLAGPAVVALDEHGRRLADALVDALPARLPDLFADGQLVVLGRYVGEAPIELALEGRWLGAERRFGLRLDPAAADARNGFVPALWAARRIAALVDGVRAAGADGAAPQRVREQANELLRLSLRFGVLTEYTAFLALPNAAGLDSEATLALVQKLLVDRAARARVGRAAIAQSINAGALREQAVLNRVNRHLDAERREVLVPGVLGVGDRAFFARGDGWVDSRLLQAGARTEVDEEVAFGSERHAELLAALAARGEAAALALTGTVTLAHAGRNYRVRQP